MTKQKPICQGILDESHAFSVNTHLAACPKISYTF